MVVGGLVGLGGSVAVSGKLWLGKAMLRYSTWCMKQARRNVEI